MSINNLAKRRLRIFLTVLGVVIGTSFIAIMFSLGFGLRKSSQELVDSSGTITTMQVSGTLEVAVRSKESRYLTDKLMEQLSRLQNEESVCPFLDINVVMRQEAYQATPTIRGAPRLNLEQIPVKRKTDSAIKENELPPVFGNEVVNDFYNYKTGKESYDTGKTLDVDLVGKSVFVIFDMDGYYGI